MLPDLFSIGPLTIHTYGVFVALAFAVSIAVTTRVARIYPISFQQVMDMAFVGVVWGVVGSRIFFVLIHPSPFFSHPLEILKVWEGGLVFSGGLLAVAAAMFFYSRRSGVPYLRIGDLWGPGIALGQAVGRIGCFMAGCCYGKPLEGAWGVVFTDPGALAPLNTPLHPAQIYSAAGGLVIFGILWILVKRKKFEGQVLLWFLILHSTARLIVERFRGDERTLFPGTDMTFTQLAALLILFGAVAALFAIAPRKPSRSGSTLP